MIELDFCYPYQLACEIRTLHQPSVSHFQIGSTKDVLTRFVSSTKKEFLPRAKEKAGELIAILDLLIPAGQSGNVVVSPEEWGRMLGCIDEFEKELEKESKHLYLACIENQRLLTPYVLIERIEDALSQKTWSFMSRLARREIEESGRCLAFERYTASGFHILRCVESIVREYVTAATGSQPTKRDWGYYIETLKQNGAADEVTDILTNIRRNDRNPLMHPEDYLKMDEAISLFNLCQTALDRLIADMEKRSFAKEFVP